MGMRMSFISFWFLSLLFFSNELKESNEDKIKRCGSFLWWLRLPKLRHSPLRPPCKSICWCSSYIFFLIWLYTMSPVCFHAIWRNVTTRNGPPPSLFSNLVGRENATPGIISRNWISNALGGRERELVIFSFPFSYSPARGLVDSLYSKTFSHTHMYTIGQSLCLASKRAFFGGRPPWALETFATLAPPTCTKMGMCSVIYNAHTNVRAWIGDKSGEEKKGSRKKSDFNRRMRYD